MKTVRFSQVVARSGEPHVHTLWLAPEKDREFTQARKTDRVMTVQRGATAEFGAVGYEPGQQYLVFPKSLKRFAGKRVVGIKFDLIAQPKAVPASVESHPRRAATTHTAKAHGRPNRRGKPPAARSPGTTPEIRPAEHPRLPEMAPAPERPAAIAPSEKARIAAPNPSDADALRREVRAALKELKAGKAVAAYQRLERAVEQ